MWKLFNADQVASALYGSPTLNTVRQALTEVWTSEFSYEKMAKLCETLQDYWNYFVHGELYRNQFWFQKTFSVADIRAQLSTITGIPLAVAVNGAIDVKIEAGLNVTNPSWFPMTVDIGSSLQSRYIAPEICLSRTLQSRFFYVSFSMHLTGVVSLADGCVQPQIRFSANANGDWAHEINGVISPSSDQPPNVSITINSVPQNETTILRFR